jgi:hypothetical protein
MTAFYINACRLLTDRNMSKSKEEIDLKGAAKFYRIPPMKLNKQNSLKCTGCGPLTTCLATKGPMVRQQSMRQKPLYLLCNSCSVSAETRGCGEIRSGCAFRTGWSEYRFRRKVTPPILPSSTARGKACHLRAQRLGIGTWEPVTPAGCGNRLAAVIGDG